MDGRIKGGLNDKRRKNVAKEEEDSKKHKEWVICSPLCLALGHTNVKDLQDWNIDVEQWDCSEK